AAVGVLGADVDATGAVGEEAGAEHRAVDPGLPGEAADALFAQQAADQGRLLARLGEGDLGEIVAGAPGILDDLHAERVGRGGPPGYSASGLRRSWRRGCA